MKKIIIVVSVVLLIILIVLLFIINNLRLSKNGLTGSSVSPTAIPDSFRERTLTTSQIATPTPSQQEVQKRIEEIKRRFKTLSPQQKDAFAKLQTRIQQQAVKTTDFDMGYSDLLNKFVIKEYTPQASQKILEFLSDPNISELYRNNADYGFFEKTKAPSVEEGISEMEDTYIKHREELLQNALGSTKGVSTGTVAAAAVENQNVMNSDPSEQLKPVYDLLKILFSFELGTSPDNTQSQPGTGPQVQNQLTGNTTLDSVINEAGQKVGTPPKLIKAVMGIECGKTLTLTDAEVTQYSQPGNGVPFCAGKPPFFDAGPMQFIVTTWPAYANAVNEFGGYTHQPYVMNIRDSVYAGALLLKKASGASQSENWTYGQVLRAITCYNAGCSKYPNRIPARTMDYFNRVWQQYTTN